MKNFFQNLAETLHAIRLDLEQNKTESRQLRKLNKAISDIEKYIGNDAIIDSKLSIEILHLIGKFLDSVPQIMALITFLIHK